MKTRPKEAFYQSFIARGPIHVPLLHQKSGQALKGRGFLAFHYTLAPVSIPQSRGCSSRMRVGRVCSCLLGVGGLHPEHVGRVLGGRVCSCPPYVPPPRGGKYPASHHPGQTVSAPICERTTVRVGVVEWALEKTPYQTPQNQCATSALFLGGVLLSMVVW